VSAVRADVDDDMADTMVVGIDAAALESGWEIERFNPSRSLPLTDDEDEDDDGVDDDDDDDDDVDDDV